jgi:hypothetical protein
VSIVSRVIVIEYRSIMAECYNTYLVLSVGEYEDPRTPT